LKKNGTVWCWGNNHNGQLGDGSSTNKNSKPVQEKLNVKTWDSASTGFGHTCGSRTDGSLWCWGHNKYGQLGNGKNLDENKPIEVIK